MARSMLSKPPVSLRLSLIKRTLWVILFLNLAVAAAKYTYGTMSGSASMQADGVHSVFDSAGNIVGLVGIAIASHPADESHPYGHGKIETFASSVIGVMLLLAAFEVGSSAVGKLMSGNYTAEVTPFSFVVMIVTLCVNVGVTFFERRQGKLLSSEILKADASHTFSDALVSVGVIIGLIFVAFGFPLADPIVALLVMGAILFTAFDVFKQALATLSDRSRISEEELHALVSSIPGVKNAHRIRTRGSEGEVFTDLHVLVNSSMTVLEAHHLGDVVEEHIRKAYPCVREVLVHIEPDDGHVE